MPRPAIIAALVVAVLIWMNRPASAGGGEAGQGAGGGGGGFW